MEPKRSKYDTNPLDQDVVAHADSSFGTAVAPKTDEVRGATRDVGRTANEAARLDPESENPTRMINEKQVTAYPSIFVPPQPRQPTYQPPRVIAPNIYQPPPVPPPTIYQPPPVPVTTRPGSNTVSGLGIPERWAVTLPYLPFYIAIVISVVELLLVPRTETRTRFHASQALVLQIGITAISMLLNIGGLITGRYTGTGLFSFATFVFLIIAMVRVWKGKPVAIPPLDDARKWLDEKIKPRK